MKTYERMIKKTSNYAFIISAAFMIAALLVNAVPPVNAYAVPAGAGAIWTTGTTCTNPDPQDDNLYSTGETVYIRGAGFVENTALTWEITQVSGPDKNLIAQGGGATDSNGYFCVTAHTIQSGESGTFTVDVVVGTAGKNDNYRVTDTTPTEPTPTEPTPTEPTPTEPTEPQVVAQVLIPVTGVDGIPGGFGSQGLFLASTAFFGFGLVLSGIARKNEE